MIKIINPLVQGQLLCLVAPIALLHKTKIMETLSPIAVPDTGTDKARPAPPTTTFDETKFFPSGAIAFFVALVILALIFWFTIYFIMLHRI